MKTPFSKIVNRRQTCCGLLAAALLTALSVPGAEQQAATLDGGGRRTASATYAMQGGFCAVAGTGTADGRTVRHGYIGQLTDVTNVTVTAAPEQINEGGTSLLSGQAGMDDGSVTILTGSELLWSPPAWPVSGIGADGDVSTLAVYADTPTVVTGRYLNVTGSGELLVLNSEPDNFGLYAADQVPDDWQVGFFGPDNEAGRATAVNATGRNNLATYIADLDPRLNRWLEITSISAGANGRTVLIQATSATRQYRLLYAAGLAGGEWSSLDWESGVQGATSLSDAEPASQRFYRVEVSLPEP